MDIPLPTNIFLMTIWYPERRKRAHRKSWQAFPPFLFLFGCSPFLKVTFSCSDCSKFSSGGRHYLPHRSSAVPPGKKRARKYHIWTDYFFSRIFSFQNCYLKFLPPLSKSKMVLIFHGRRQLSGKAHQKLLWTLLLVTYCYLLLLTVLWAYFIYNVSSWHPENRWYETFCRISELMENLPSCPCEDVRGSALSLKEQVMQDHVGRSEGIFHFSYIFWDDSTCVDMGGKWSSIISHHHHHYYPPPV